MLNARFMGCFILLTSTLTTNVAYLEFDHMLSFLKTGFCTRGKGGIGCGSFSHGVLCTWWLSCLAIGSSWSARLGHFLYTKVLLPKGNNHQPTKVALHVSDNLVTVAL